VKSAVFQGGTEEGKAACLTSSTKHSGTEQKASGRDHVVPLLVERAVRDLPGTFSARSVVREVSAPPQSEEVGMNRRADTRKGGTPTHSAVCSGCTRPSACVVWLSS
jgi:hypothetical protein